MAFNGTEGGAITLEVAAAMTASYRKLNPGQTEAHFMGKDNFLALLNQTGCVGIRVYHGHKSDGGKEVIFVGVDANENDMLELIMDLSICCPPTCSNGNALNGR
ncbi:MAG: hypothetical protein A3D31_12165 [Candidatus Fluviicola riflensis]|nr:MAG: hypothetical protein CHH17_16600 [Candidatus Fluviicola riflensis]OGS77740.1 MAG: hypothetical protein A3D31_12165 [Candidatus Fluviicola riflensis]OGS84323.1 MAG: hypothetical protein A3E30_13575 [Fluviicola sp. RIFCSPHIGHO2_12_FULL_43_24]OGS84805.1 MAG: hypothetical protein A2724_09100 [Fluviicola sp. RIFCSPHIGHO2_01_FULL_43_53]